MKGNILLVHILEIDKNKSIYQLRETTKNFKSQARQSSREMIKNQVREWEAPLFRLLLEPSEYRVCPELYIYFRDHLGCRVFSN